MPGPNPKPASTRARRNRASTSATLQADPTLPIPNLPGDHWHPMTLQFWTDLWSSPMAPEYDDSDKHGLFMLAQIVNDFWTTESADMRSKLAAEIRMQRNRYGLSPMDRRSLQWEIQRVEEGQERATKRAARSATPAPASKQSNDPRAVLRVV